MDWRVIGHHRDGHRVGGDQHLVPGVGDLEGRVLGGEVVHHARHGHLGGGHSWRGQGRDDVPHLDTVGIEVNSRGDGGERVDLPEVALGRWRRWSRWRAGRGGRREGGNEDLGGVGESRCYRVEYD